MKTVFMMVCCMCFCAFASAQETCTEKLFRANQYYEKGQLNEAIELALGCSQQENSTSERWQAYRLLAMAYLATGDHGEAKKVAENMLEINPEYTPSKIKDPVELINLLKEINIIPKFTLGLAATIGGNLTVVDLQGTYNAAECKKEYTSKGSWQIGLTTGYNWNKVISIQSGLIASSNRYSIDYSVGDWDMHVEERLTYLTIPLLARFVTKEEIKTLRFFADAGGFLGFLTSATTDISRKNGVTQEGKEELNLDATQRRNTFEYGLLYGGGVMKKIGQINLAFDIRYYLSYANITNEENRYTNSNLLYGYYYIDDDLRLNNLAISLSVIYNLNYKVIRAK